MDRYYTEFMEACHSVMYKDCAKYFKRYNPEMPRISKVLGILKSISPTTILDVGTGRGRALWPMLYNLPETDFICVDPVEWRCNVINAVNKGGVNRVIATTKNILDLQFKDNTFDVITALEVLEHIPLVHDALGIMLKLAKDFVIITVPSKPDNNPEHVHYFNKDYMTYIITEQASLLGINISKLQFEHAGNSMLVLIGLCK